MAAPLFVSVTRGTFLRGRGRYLTRACSLWAVLLYGRDTPYDISGLPVWADTSGIPFANMTAPITCSRWRRLGDRLLGGLVLTGKLADYREGRVPSQM